MSYIGSTPTTQSFISGTDYFNGTGSQTAFTLSRNVASVNDVEAVVNNVVQQPNSAYTLSGTTITFTSAPSAGTNNIYVRYLSTTTQSITPSQNTVSYATWNSDLQSETWAFRNRLINGDMTIDQRNNGASVAIPNDSNFYTLDRWQIVENTGAVLSAQRVADAPTGFVNSLRVSVTTAAGSIGSSELSIVEQRIEGFNMADLGFGTANAQTVTVSFWVKSSITGTFGGSLRNGGSTRSYPFSYTIAAANTWEYKTVTIPGDVTGTWATDNTAGMRVTFAIGSGSSRLGTANAWATANLDGVTGSTAVVTTLNATWQVTGVQLEKGFTATNFDVLPYGTELQLCRRYYWRISATGSLPLLAFGAAGSSTELHVVGNYPVEMRATPTLSGSANQVQTSSATGATAVVSSFSFSGTNQSYRAVFVAPAANLTVNTHPYFVRALEPGGFIDFSAEL
jgi:hypothetical protein